MPEFVTVNGQRIKATDAMLDELSAVHKGWQSERDFIRTICEVNMHWADDNSRAVVPANATSPYKKSSGTTNPTPYTCSCYTNP